MITIVIALYHFLSLDVPIGKKLHSLKIPLQDTGGEFSEGGVQPLGTLLG